MKKINKRIEIVIASQKGMHSMSHSTAQGIKQVLKMHFLNVDICFLSELKDLEELVGRKPDLVFGGMKRLLLADGGFVSVSGYLESQGITVTGSDSDAIELERDKTIAKDAISSAGLATSQYILANIDQRYDEDSLSLRFPLFIKPSNRGAGLGISEMSVVRSFKELNAGIQSLVDEGFEDIIVESFLSGREFSIVILKKEGQEQYQIMPLELIAPENKNGDRFLSEGIKNDDTEACIVVESGKLRDELVNFASKSFIALGARDYGRVDIRLNDKGVPQFLEANLMPSLVNGFGNFPKACLLIEGLDYESVILRITNLALSRNKVKSTM